MRNGSGGSWWRLKRWDSRRFPEGGRVGRYRDYMSLREFGGKGDTALGEEPPRCVLGLQRTVLNFRGYGDLSAAVRMSCRLRVDLPHALHSE